MRSSPPLLMRLLCTGRSPLLSLCEYETRRSVSSLPNFRLKLLPSRRWFSFRQFRNQSVMAGAFPTTATPTNVLSIPIENIDLFSHFEKGSSSSSCSGSSSSSTTRAEVTTPPRYQGFLASCWMTFWILWPGLCFFLLYIVGDAPWVELGRAVKLAATFPYLEWLKKKFSLKQ